MKYMLDEITKIKSICVLYLLFPFLVFLGPLWIHHVLFQQQSRHWHLKKTNSATSWKISCFTSDIFVKHSNWVLIFCERAKMLLVPLLLGDRVSVSCRAGFSWIFPLLTSPPLLDPLSWLRHLYRSVAAKTLEVDHHSVNLSSPCVFKLFDSWIGNFIMFSSSYANITLLR